MAFSFVLVYGVQCSSGTPKSFYSNNGEAYCVQNNFYYESDMLDNLLKLLNRSGYPSSAESELLHFAVALKHFGTIDD